MPLLVESCVAMGMRYFLFTLELHSQPQTRTCFTSVAQMGTCAGILTPPRTPTSTGLRTARHCSPIGSAMDCVTKITTGTTRWPAAGMAVTVAKEPALTTPTRVPHWSITVWTLKLVSTTLSTATSRRQAEWGMVIATTSQTGTTPTFVTGTVAIAAKILASMGLQSVVSLDIFAWTPTSLFRRRARETRPPTGEMATATCITKPWSFTW